jgi:deoxyadenosine/deoxycytidine kinase
MYKNAMYKNVMYKNVMYKSMERRMKMMVCIRVGCDQFLQRSKKTGTRAGLPDFSWYKFQNGEKYTKWP